MNINEWEKLEYYDPKGVLISLRQIAEKHPLEELPYKVASLRSRELRPYNESRQCAIFCYGINQAIGYDVSYTQLEKSDYDFIARFPRNEEMIYVPIQLKELVPAHLNKLASLQKEIDKLTKYVDSEDLIVAIHLNRQEKIEFSEIQIPKLNIKELWLFGASEPGQSKWWLIGDLLSNPIVYGFHYP